VSTSGRCNPPEPAEQSVELRVERVGGSGAPLRALAVVALIGSFVTVLWLKPWAGDTSPVAVVPVPANSVRPAPLDATEPDAAPPDLLRPPPLAPEATPDPMALAARRAHCRQAQTWRLVSMEESPRWKTRTMWGVTPQDATGPLDESLKATIDHAARLTAIGVCAPATPVMSPVDGLLHAVLWHVGTDGRAREITRPVIVDQELFDLGEAYYGPPEGEGDSWAPGRYVFEIKRIAGGGSRFMALDFIPTNPPEGLVSP
jgi:hypothetical protein